MAIPFYLFGAGKEARTLDLDLGKVALYQLSYSRIVVATCAALIKRIIEDEFRFVKKKFVLRFVLKKVKWQISRSCGLFAGGKTR